jgi:hypothetical protein
MKMQNANAPIVINEMILLVDTNIKTLVTNDKALQQLYRNRLRQMLRYLPSSPG